MLARASGNPAILLIFERLAAVLREVLEQRRLLKVPGAERTNATHRPIFNEESHKISTLYQKSEVVQ